MDGDELIREAVRTAAEAVGDAVGDKVADLLERLAGDAVDELGKRLGAAVRAPAADATGFDATIARWRARNVLEVLARVRAMLDARGVEARQVPAAFLVPLVDEAARVVDEPLRACWAMLLANGVVSAAAQHPMHARVLAQLSTEDLEAFRRACAHADELHVKFGKAQEPPSFMDDDPDDVEARLATLGLIVTHTMDTLDGRVARGAVLPEPLASVFGMGTLPSRFGYSFRCAVLEVAAA